MMLVSFKDKSTGSRMWISLKWLPGAFKYQTDFGMGDMIFFGILLFTNKKNTLLYFQSFRFNVIDNLLIFT